MRKRDFYEQREQEPQADELARARRKKKRRRFFQKALALLLVGAAVWGLLFLRKDIARLDFGMRFSDLLASYSTGNGYPAELPAGKVVDLAPLGKDMVLLTDTMLMMYNSNGKCTGSYEHGYTAPISLTSGDRVLTFDRGGKRFRVDSRSSALFDGETDYTISTADIASSGHVAVVSGAKYYHNSITVYDADYDEIYIRETADLITDVCLENKGGGMAAASVDAVDGRLDSTVTFFSFSQEEPVAETVLEDELILSMAFVGRGSETLQVITDRQALLLDRQGRITAQNSFDDLFVNRFVNSKNGGIYLLLDQLGDGNRLQLVALDRELNPVGQLPLENRVQDMRLGDRYLCLFAAGDITCYSLDLSEQFTAQLENCYHYQPAGQYLYGITADTIELLKPETAAAS